MIRFLNSLRQLAWIFILTATTATLAQEGEDIPAGDSDWTRIVRASPYWVSQGVFENILTIRRWVLKESGYCSSSGRHILFDMRGQFLAWISDGDDREATQRRLNETRQSLYGKGRVETWVPGDAGQTGYPFALSCDQPHVNINEAIARYLGTLPGDRIWGTWDDLSFATSRAPGTLHDALLYVSQYRNSQNRLSLPETLPR